MSDLPLIRSARGSTFSLIVSGATLLLGFTRSVLLMRLLGPEPFGLATLALFFANFLAPFASLGLDGALIQRKEISPETLSTHFVLRISGGLGMLGLGFLAAPALRRAYPNPAVDFFLFLLLVNLLESSSSTHSAVLRRELRFEAFAGLNLAASLAMTVIAPWLAYMGAGLWSLAAEQAVSSLARWAGNWLVLRPWRPAWRPALAFRWIEAKTMLRFGSRLVSADLLGVLLDRFDDFWTGTALGAVPLGYYSRAYAVAQYPERVLATPVTNVYFSTYAALQTDRARLSQAFIRSSHFLVKAGFLLGLVLAATAPELTLVLFGPKWTPIVPLFRLLIVYVLLNPLYNNLSYLVIGAGQPGLLTRVRLGQLVFFALAVITLSRLWGLPGVAIAADLMMLGGVIALAVLSRRFIDLDYTRLLRGPLLAAGLGGLAAWWMEAGLALNGALLGLALKTLLLSGPYLGVLWFMERALPTTD